MPHAQSAPDWNAARRLFPVLDRWAHLNTAAFGPLPSVAAAAVREHLRARDRNAALDFPEWFDRLELIRGKLGQLIGASPRDIAFCPNAGTGLSWLLRGIEWRHGDEILAFEHEFPNNLYAPQLLDTLGVAFRPLPSPRTAFDADTLLDEVGPRTRLVLLSTVNYSNGLRAPCEELAAELRRRSVLLCLDATQSVGALRHDLESSPADFLVAHGYKWLMAPAGAGFAWVPPTTRSWLAPSITSWRSHRDWMNFEHLHHGRPVLPESAAAYEGGVQAFTALFGLEASVDLILRLGLDRIETRILGLAERCREIVAAHGGVLHPAAKGPAASQIVTASFPRLDSARLAARLRESRVAVSVRQGNLRVSPHFFNNHSDLRRLSHALAA